MQVVISHCYRLGENHGTTQRRIAVAGIEAHSQALPYQQQFFAR